jgi:hypothetical protein
VDFGAKGEVEAGAVSRQPHQQDAGPFKDRGHLESARVDILRHQEDLYGHVASPGRTLGEIDAPQRPATADDPGMRVEYSVS